jgi:hypothetical protein
MRQIAIVIILGILCSCGFHKNLSFNSSKIDFIEIYQGFPGKKISMKEGIEKELIADLNKSKELGPTKYMKTHRILINYKDKTIDTIYTNGTIHNFRNWYKSDENLIEKYSIKQSNLTDTIYGQLKTAEQLKRLMFEKKYDEAILLFSDKQQININEIKKDNEMFNYWCMAWTFDEAKFERYTNRIKLGKGKFAYEKNEWKIDEK